MDDWPTFPGYGFDPSPVAGHPVKVTQRPLTGGPLQAFALRLDSLTGSIASGFCALTPRRDLVERGHLAVSAVRCVPAVPA
jgi:hypothetical protein